ncbi:hypothetical protein GCM10020370_12310 [Paenibacillus hodogayensis]
MPEKSGKPYHEKIPPKALERLGDCNIYCFFPKSGFPHKVEQNPYILQRPGFRVDFLPGTAG